MELIITLSIIIIVIVLIVILARRLTLQQQSGKALALRPFSAHKALKGQVGRAVESASRLHISLGPGQPHRPNQPRESGRHERFGSIG